MWNRMLWVYVLVLATLGVNIIGAKPIGDLSFEELEVTNVGSNGAQGFAFEDDFAGLLVLVAEKGIQSDSREEVLFAHKAVEGDVEIVAKLESLTGFANRSIAGLMFRTDLDSDSQQVSIVVDYNLGIAFLGRATKSVPIEYHSQFVPTEQPIHLALLREGDLFSAFIASDASELDWHPLGDPFSVSMPSRVEAGLFAGSDNDFITFADFSEISINSLGVRNSRFVSQTLSATMNPDTSQSVSLIFENTGSATWLASSGVHLQWIGSEPNPWGVDSVPLQSGASILQGDSLEFAFDIVAPAIPGDYDFRWQMSQLGSEGFGELSPSILIDVVEPPASDGGIVGEAGAFYPEFLSESFQESGGEVIFEAEAYHAVAAGTHGEVWQDHSYPNQSGFSLMAVPNVAVNTRLKTNGARADYYFNIQTPGEYYLYVRGADSEGNELNNSVHAAIDEQVLTDDGGLGLTDFVGAFSWQQRSGKSLSKVKVAIPNPGVHKLTIWSREDGVIIDRLALSTDGKLSSSYLDGLSNSSRVSGSDGIERPGPDEQDGGDSTDSESPSASLPPFEMKVRELGYSHVELAWNDKVSWKQPWMIQRSTIPSFIDPSDLTHNQASDNTGSGTFRWLGVNADNFVDIDGIDEGTTYYWRVAPVTNLSAHYRKGSKPTYGKWIYGSATTKTLSSSKKRTYNVKNYGAVPNDGKNDYPAALAALKAAESAGGGTVYFPAGTYDLWPTDGDVRIESGIPTLRPGRKAVSTLFKINSDNITFLGDSSGAPKTFWKLYLWGKKPATSWLQVKNSSGRTTDIRRYFVFKPMDVAQTTIRNIDVDMGATPVNTGKEWYTLDQKRFEWDISHKFWSAHDTTRGKNTIIENVRVKNCRGEIIYVGGASEKILIKGCILDRSNSSSISMSADAEIVNTIIKDSSNAAVESILLASRAGLDGKPFAMNHIARGCTFIGLDQSASGHMKKLPGKKTFSGWHVFNDEGTYQSVTDSTFKDCINNSFGPWYEYRNGLRFNCTFGAVPSGQQGSTIFTWTSSQSDYLIDGGMSEILWVGDTVNVEKNWGENSPFFYSQPSGTAQNSESSWIWDSVHFKKTGGGRYQIGRIWLDTASQSTARRDVVFKNWTSDSGISFADDKLLFLHSSADRPTFVNFLE